MTTESQTIIRAALPLALKLASDKVSTGELEGYASVFGGEPDSYGDLIAPGAFSKSLTDLKRRGESPVMLWAHDQSSPIGRWTWLSEDGKGLLVRGKLNLETERGREAHAHVKAGDVTGLSIGYRVPPGTIHHHNDGTQTLTEVDLREISVVALPAARSARIHGVKTIGSQRELQSILHDIGLPRAAAHKVAAAGWPALNSSEPETPEFDIKAFAARVRAAGAQIRTK